MRRGLNTSKLQLVAVAGCLEQGPSSPVPGAAGLEQPQAVEPAITVVTAAATSAAA